METFKSSFAFWDTLEHDLEKAWNSAWYEN